MKARLRVAIGPSDVGQRVTLRVRTYADEHEPALTDVVGVLTSWQGERLRVRRRDGELVTVVTGDLVAARVVPPATKEPHR